MCGMLYAITWIEFKKKQQMNHIWVILSWKLSWFSGEKLLLNDSVLKMKRTSEITSETLNLNISCRKQTTMYLEWYVVLSGGLIHGSLEVLV